MKSILRLFVALLILSVGSSALAQTDVFGSINSDQTWTVAGSPYLLHADVTVLNGVTLTVDAGVRVEFLATGNGMGGLDSTRIELSIQGHLQVNASASEPAVFTTSDVVPTAGDFYGIVFLAGGTGDVTGAKVE